MELSLSLDNNEQVVHLHVYLRNFQITVGHRMLFIVLNLPSRTTGGLAYISNYYQQPLQTSDVTLITSVKTIQH